MGELGLAGRKGEGVMQIIRLKDIQYPKEFEVPFPCVWATVYEGEIRLVMHRSQLEELAEVLEAVMADLPDKEAA